MKTLTALTATNPIILQVSLNDLKAVINDLRAEQHNQPAVATANTPQLKQCGSTANTPQLKQCGSTSINPQPKRGGRTAYFIDGIRVSPMEKLVYSHLARGGKYSALELAFRCNTSNALARICDMRSRGIRIDDEWRYNADRASYYKVYFLRNRPLF